MPLLDITHPDFSITIPGNYTHTQLFDLLIARFDLCGWGAPVAVNGTGNALRVAVWDVNFNPAKAFGVGRFVLEVNNQTVTTHRLRVKLYSPANYNISTFTQVNNAGANTNNGVTFDVAFQNPLTIYRLPLNLELTGLLLLEATTTFRGFLGMFYPSNWESWWDENLHNRVLLPASTNPSNLFHTHPNPQVNVGTTVINARFGLPTFANRNPNTNELYLVPSTYITSHTAGLAGQCPDWIAVSNNTGLNSNDISIVTPGIEEWWNLQCGDNGVAIRCV